VVVIHLHYDRAAATGLVPNDVRLAGGYNGAVVAGIDNDLLQQLASSNWVDDVLEGRERRIYGFDRKLESEIFEPTGPTRLPEGDRRTSFVPGRAGSEWRKQVANEDHPLGLGARVSDAQ
jgi:hypothetical protein